MEKTNTTCPKCGGGAERRENLFVCSKCGFAFLKFGDQPLIPVTYWGTVKSATMKVTVDTGTGEVLESKAFYEGEGGENGD